MSKSTTNDSPLDHQSLQPLDFTQSIEASVGAASTSVNVLFVADQTGGDDAVIVSPVAEHDVSNTNIANVSADHSSLASGAYFVDTYSTDHSGVTDLSYSLTGDHSLGDQLSSLFDNLDIGSSHAPATIDIAEAGPTGNSGDLGSSAFDPIDVFSDSHGGGTPQHGHGSGGGGGGGGTPSPTPSPAGFVINVTYDSSVGSAPSAFTTAVNEAVQYLESHFSDPVTINIDVGNGEVGGQKLGPGALGESMTYLLPESYSTLVNALTADASSGFDQSAVASLPSTDPAGNFYVSTAEGKALGLMSATATGVDGYIGFSSQPGIFDYNNTDGVSSGTYDFFGVVLHEITEVMGRILMAGGTSSTSYNMLYDLFHYSAPGVLDFSASTPGYFSADSGVTNLNSFNTTSGGDAGDWSGKTVDAFNAFATSGAVLPISNADLVALDAIGWNSTGTTTSSGTSTSGSTTMAQLENQHPPA